MNDELIVEENSPSYHLSAPPSTPRPSNAPPAPTRSSNRPRMPSLAGREVHTLAEAAAAKSNPQSASEVYGPGTAADRATRSKTKPLKLAPKLKLKLGEKASQGIMTSFLGTYDRDLDSDDEDLHFEEQFVLRMPEGEDSEKLRAMVAKREVSSDVWFKFKDSRRGVFHIGTNTYRSKLVDLPCVIEAQKTLDNKQMFKIADICQMLVVEDRLEKGEDLPNSSAAFHINDFIWPHGITPPLKHVRKRRFRKRMSRAAIEVVEQEVERLLEEDSKASKVEYDVLENVNPDLSDNEFDIDNKFANSPDVESGGLGFGFDQAPTPDADAASMQGDAEIMEDEEGEAGGDESDDDLAAELERAMNGDAEGDDSADDDDDDDDDDDESDEDGEDDEDRELAQARSLLNEEVADLEAAVAKKIGEIASSGNPLIKRRFEDALKKLQADLDTKIGQREQLMAKPQEDGNEMDVEGEGDGFDDLFDGDDEDDEDDDEPPVAAAPEVDEGPADVEVNVGEAEEPAAQTVPKGPVMIELG